MKSLNYLSYLTLFSFCFLFLNSCEKPNFEKDCGGNNPLENLEWLKSMIENHDEFSNEGISYIRFIYNDELYIIRSYCGLTSLSFDPMFYTCKGKEVSFNKDELNELYEAMDTWGRLIWKGTGC